MNITEQLANQFRIAIESARDSGEFNKDCSFRNFPHGCCGDACDLLAQYLLENGIETFYVYGTFYKLGFKNTQTHAWLLTDCHTIIDITGDQFMDNPVFLNNKHSVYIGIENEFYRLFEVDDRNIRKCLGIAALGSMCQPRLNNLYQKIIKYVEPNIYDI